MNYLKGLLFVAKRVREVHCFITHRPATVAARQKPYYSKRNRCASTKILNPECRHWRLCEKEQQGLNNLQLGMYK
jgi:hypothetical protein